MAEEEIPNKELVDAFQKMHLVFTDLFLIAKSYGNFKDTWNYEMADMFSFGQLLYAESKKTGNTFEIGIEYDYIFLKMNVQFAENIKHMSDEFWKLVTKTGELGDLVFKEDNFIGNKNMNRFKNNKSIIFRMIRNYVILSLNDEGDLDSPGYLGWLEIKWKFNENWEQILINLCQAFKYFYQMNYMLWKTRDLKRKRIYKERKL
ncbi:MAG TPA: hypothetical protein PKG52_04770 [bacterium]|nr:hypothetical protein [bacterium]